MALGATGALCGTTFFASDESLASESAKQAALQGSGDDTERSSVFDVARDLDWPSDWNLRTLRNTFTRRWSGDMAALNQNLAAERDRFNAAAATDDTDIVPVIVGEAVDLIHARRSAQAILREMMAQAEDRVRYLGKSVAPIKED